MSLVEKVNNLADSIKDKVDDIDKPIIIDVKAIKRAGSDCLESAKQTSELCSSTIEKARQMSSFGDDVRRTLDSFSGGVDAETFETIRDLIDGDKVRAATVLARDVDVLAVSCVEKSVDMIDAMERGVDALPDFIENRIEDKLERAVEKGSRDGDPDLPNVESDIKELTNRIDAVEKVNLFTIMKSGIEAFQSLSTKGDLCRTMFRTIKDFAQSVSEVAESIKSFDFGSSIGKIKSLVKDLWRCLRLSSLIKAFSESVGKLIRYIVRLFRASSSRLGSIWGSLSHAKEVMKKCLSQVLDANRLTDEARSKSTDLITTSDDITTKLKSVTEFNRGSITSAVDLLDGSEIRAALDIATDMDDTLLGCVKSVLEMIKSVKEGVSSLPEVLQEGMPSDAGSDENDPAPADLARDVQDVERCCQDVEGANPLSALATCVEGFTKVHDESIVCRDLIDSSQTFSSGCKDAIESFLGVWDLETAADRLLKMSRLAKLGEMLDQYAEEVMKLVKATIKLIKAIMVKIKGMNANDVAKDAIDMYESIRDSLCGAGNSLCGSAKS